jgi:hypothetical protein
VLAVNQGPVRALLRVIQVLVFKPRVVTERSGSNLLQQLGLPLV